MSYHSATNIFDEWKAAHDHLTRATQSFFDACATLLQFIDESPASSAREKSVEDVVIAVYGHRKTFFTTEKRVQESHAILRKVINKSITLVPSNVLPLEVMSHIFTLLVEPSACVNKQRFCSRRIGHDPQIYRSHPLVVTPSVCTQWRRLAIRTPSLWSHVDIGRNLRGITEGSILPRTRLWLERARGAPLSLHIELTDQKLGKRWDLASLLKPYIVNLTHLKLSGQCAAHFVSILSLYANTCPLGSLESLSVELDRTERITGSFIWPTNALRGLTCLKLCSGHRDALLLGIDGLVTILANNPALHTLQLESALSITDSHHSYPKIGLPCLRLLKLECPCDGDLSILLSTLVPGSLEVDARLRLSLQIDQTLRAAILSFLQRTSITRLYLSAGPLNEVSWLVEQLNCVPRLQMLALERGGCDDWAILGALTLPTTRDNFGARCPSLRMLWIGGSSVNLKAYTQLKRIVSCHQLKTIIFGHGTTPFEGIGKSEADEWFRQRVGDVVYKTFEFFEGWEWGLNLH